MILASEIPSDPAKSIQRCTADSHVSELYAKPASTYLDYLATETERRYPALFRYVKVLHRETGAPRFSADADRVIPRSVWNLLMPGPLQGKPDERFPAFSGVISNLFWRDRQFNRKDDALAIRVIQDAKTANLSRAERSRWQQKWTEIFLMTKRDEGVLCTAEPHDPWKLDELIGPSGHSNWMAHAAKSG